MWNTCDADAEKEKSLNFCITVDM